MAPHSLGLLEETKRNAPCKKKVEEEEKIIFCGGLLGDDADDDETRGETKVKCNARSRRKDETRRGRERKQECNMCKEVMLLSRSI